MNKTKKLIILENSLSKKERELEEKYKTHFDTVKLANGQPLNDKGVAGARMLNKWEKQSEGLRRMEKEIEKTKDAINDEKWLIIGSERELEKQPQQIKELVQNGELVQWRKHPRFFFIKGVDKVRIFFDEKSKKVKTKYANLVPRDQLDKFKETLEKLK